MYKFTFLPELGYNILEKVQS